MSAAFVPRSRRFVLYVDPGAGSYALQLILAAATGGLYVVLQRLSDVPAAIRRRFKRDRSDR